eukprot:UN23991
MHAQQEKIDNLNLEVQRLNELLNNPISQSHGNCDVSKFENDVNYNGYDVFCFTESNFSKDTKYKTQTNGKPCTEKCKTVDGVESSEICHNIVKKWCDADYFSYKSKEGRCWAKASSRSERKEYGFTSGPVETEYCQEKEVDNDVKKRTMR